MDNIKRYQLDDQIKEITVDQYKWFVKPSVILKSHREERKHGTKYEPELLVTPRYLKQR